MKTKIVERGTPEFEQLAAEVHAPRARWDRTENTRGDCEFRIKQQLFTLALCDVDTPRQHKMRKELIASIETLERRMQRKGFA